MRSAQEFNDVQRLIADGMNDCAIARITGIPRRTVRDWRCKPPIWPRNRIESASCRAEHYFSTIPAEAYCYLLGLYLSDGCISRHEIVPTEDNARFEVPGDRGPLSSSGRHPHAATVRAGAAAV
jgi:hypothetical protein